MDAVTLSILGTAVTAGLGFVVALVRIALGAERRRADDWRTAARTSLAANAVLTGHVETLIGSVGQLSTAQREMMSLLQAMAAQGRSAA